MSSIQEFSITPTGRKNVPGSIPTFTITAIVYSDDGQVIADLTGANVIQFPAVMVTLSDAEAAKISQIVAQWLVRRAAGILNPLTGE